MIVDPNKFQVILLDKRKSDRKNHRIVVDNQNIKVASSAELLGIQIDDNLSFKLHISNIYWSAANKLNALFKLKRFCYGFKSSNINEIMMAILNFFIQKLHKHKRHETFISEQE